MMAAIQAAKHGAAVTIIERKALGTKLRITGKGRCNITNAADISDFFPNIRSNANFLYSAFYNFTNADLIAFFNEIGVPTKVERGERVFPLSDSAHQVTDALVKQVNSLNVNIVYGRAAELVVEEGVCKGVILDSGRTLQADAVIIATGGLSYPKTGSTGDGYAMAQAVGHTVAKTTPSLVPIETYENFPVELQGLSLKNIAVKLYNTTGKLLFEDFGEMLFTHFGISGPVILSASAHIKQADGCKLSIDLKPALTEEMFDARLLREFEQSKNKDIINALDSVYPKKLIPIILELSGIQPNTKVNSITKAQRQAIVNTTKSLTLTLKRLRPIEEAIITAGGISTKEIDPQTMKSKILDRLYFAGEVIDIDAYTGGFNLQIAFSTGYLAGVSAAQA